MESKTMTASGDGVNLHSLVRREVRTFAAFLGSDACHGLISDEFRDRLKLNCGGVKTVTMLKNWAKERYPADYPPQGWRVDTSDMSHGKEAMLRLWAAFLTWAETNG